MQRDSGHFLAKNAHPREALGDYRPSGIAPPRSSILRFTHADSGLLDLERRLASLSALADFVPRVSNGSGKSRSQSMSTRVTCRPLVAIASRSKSKSIATF